jgi:hypothetical protein
MKNAPKMNNLLTKKRKSLSMPIWLWNMVHDAMTQNSFTMTEQEYIRLAVRERCVRDGMPRDYLKDKLEKTAEIPKKVGGKGAHGC